MASELAPCLLVAAPSLSCPFFHHTVVLLVDHREEGSLGFVVNRPAGVGFSEVLKGLGLSGEDLDSEDLSARLSDMTPTPVDGIARATCSAGVSRRPEDESGETAASHAQVMVGGPVSSETGWIVYDPGDASWPEEGTIRVTERVAVSASMKMLEVLAGGSGPAHGVMMLGYAGWGPGQLDEEIRQGSWIPVDLDPSLVFETPIPDRWGAALGKLGIDPGRVAHNVASA